MHKFMGLLCSRISEGLKEKSIRSCSDWTEMYRVMGQPFPGPWTFEHHPWLKQMMNDDNPMIIGEKSAQMGFTEVAMNKTFYAIDFKGISVMYFLPASKPDATDFSTGRFDPALEMSPHLSKLFSDTSNIGHKRAGNANLYVRGARSRSQAKSVPCGMMIFDELDEMNQKIVTLALERMSGHKDKHCMKISTPTVDKFGIDAEYIHSDQKHFFFRCPHCGKLTELIFPECLKITCDDYTDSKIFDSYLQCKECKGILGHDNKTEWLKDGEWVAAHPKKIISGYHINQLYSSTIAPHEIGIAYLKSIIDATEEQEFYNSKLGMPHVIEGARVTAEDINSCIKEYRMQEIVSSRRNIITMGVDVGKFLHYEIVQWSFINDRSSHDINLIARSQVIKIGKVNDFEQLDNLMLNFCVRHCIIDAQPENRKSLEFARRFAGHVQCCWYGKGIKTKQINPGSEPEYVTVDRTSWLDMSLGRFQKNSIILPLDTPKEYKDHIKALVRVYEKDNQGNPIGRYVKSVHEQDHYAHAHNYAEIALNLAVSFAASQDMESPI
jgi:hypothetical protein